MTYNPGLVALSYLIAAYTSFAFLGIAKRIYHDEHKQNWLGMGSLTMGLGIWSMHFVGMLARAGICKFKQTHDAICSARYYNGRNKKQYTRFQ